MGVLFRNCSGVLFSLSLSLSFWIDSHLRLLKNDSFKPDFSDESSTSGVPVFVGLTRPSMTFKVAKSFSWIRVGDGVEVVSKT